MHYGYKNHVKADAKSKLIERYAVTDASVHDSQMLAPLVAPTAPTAARKPKRCWRRKQVTSHIHERAYRNRPLSDEQKESNRQKSKLWVTCNWLLVLFMVLIALASMTSGAVKDPYYPQYHLAPTGGWMNDPHPIYFKGSYHIFFQSASIPDDPYGGAQSWGHVASDDLVHWKHFPLALTPRDHGITKSVRYQPAHIWSGCVVDNNGVGTAVYTIDNFYVWIATSPDNDLATFKKYPGNPVIKGPPPGLPVGEMRDPWVWKERDGWYLIVGCGLGNKGPVLPLYKSTDLIHWEYLHPLYQGEGSKFDFLGDAGWSDCPSFFPLGDKYVLVLSDRTTYLVGRYEEHRFIPERRGRLDYPDPVKGGGIYAPQFAFDDKGRRLMWGWVGLGKVGDRQKNNQAGWAGMLTIPRVLTLVILG